MCRWRGGLKTRPFLTVSTLTSLLVLLCSCGNEPIANSAARPGEHSDLSGPSGQIVQKYVQATEAHENALRGVSMEVQISANVPGLKQHGTLRALRRISRLGQITYHVLDFEGDSTIKKDVIARYLQAEQQSQGDQNLAITPANYKFHYRGTKGEDGRQVYVFQLTPRKSRIGLFKGQIAIDSKTYLPIDEKGRLVKNPSIFFKHVDFERQYMIQNGLSVPERVTSTIDVRLVGKVEINISYSDLKPAGDDANETTSAAQIEAQ